jgi:phosphate transport system protein
MSTHLHRDVELLKKKILGLSAKVEEGVQKALESYYQKDKALAIEVITADAEIDRMEIGVEEYCLKILALHQPVAIDLRFIVAVLKMTNDLERIGDLAVNIAEQAVFQSRLHWSDIPDDLGLMSGKARSMLKRCLDALVNLDADLARRVFNEDDEVDDLLRRMYAYVMKQLTDHSDNMESLMSLLFVSRYLERIADLATNIAEDVYYMIKGEIVRHRWKENR